MSNTKAACAPRRNGVSTGVRAQAAPGRLSSRCFIHSETMNVICARGELRVSNTRYCGCAECMKTTS